jgi:hypothetical protein
MNYRLTATVCIVVARWQTPHNPASAFLVSTGLVAQRQAMRTPVEELNNDHA